MHVGVSFSFQNLDGARTDKETYDCELGIADLVEPLGFDSIWSPEHHFNGYVMCPNVSQFLTYMAGRTSRIKLGSMANILPWHDPVRVAEEVALLDIVSNGRAIFGIGRGLAREEFEGFRIPMGESRERFVSYSQAIIAALETGYIECDDRLYRQPRTAIRPAPFLTFRNRIYAASVSPESAKIMAKLGAGLLVIAQKPWDKTVADLEMYREIYREINGSEAPKPILCTWMACAETEDEAFRIHRNYSRRYSESIFEQYEFGNKEFSKINGYEYYAALARTIEKHGKDAFIDFLVNLQVYGTPDQAYERLMERVNMLDAGALVISFSHGGMPYDVAERQMRLFAKSVLPKLKSHDCKSVI